MKKFFSLVLALVMALSLTTVAWGADVAKIGNTGYATLQAAVDAARDGETITLLSDIEYNSSNCGFTDLTGPWYDGVKYTGDKSFTIDLNGKTISDNGTLNDYLLNFINKGTKANEITLKNGTISGGANLWNVISVGASSEEYPTTFNLGDALTINADGSGNSGEDGVVKVRGNSVMNVLSGATVVSTNALYGVQAAAGTATLNIYDGATVTMNMSSGAAVTGVGIVNIYGGTITSAGWGVFTSSSGTPEFTIYGGSITGTAGAVASCADVSSYPTADPSVTISGGDINGAVSKQVYGTSAGTAGGEVIVTGGIFDTNPAGYAASGYEAASVGANGEYIVGKDIEVDANGKITAGTFNDDVSAYMAAGVTQTTTGVIVSSSTHTEFDTKDAKTLAVKGTKALTLIPAKGAYVATATGNWVGGWVKHYVDEYGVEYVPCTADVDGALIVYYKGTNSVYDTVVAANPFYEAVATEFTSFGTACGQLDNRADTTAKYYTYADGNGIVYLNKGTTATAKQVMVNGKLVGVEAANLIGNLNAHKWVVEKNAKNEVTKATCSLCGQQASWTLNLASVPTGATFVPAPGGGFLYWNAAPVVDTDTKVESAETFDAGIAMYVGMSVMAAAGSVVVLKKRED